MKIPGALITLVLIVFSPGCNQQLPPQPQEPAKNTKGGTDQVAQAKAHVQQFIDRLLGGDQTVKDGLLSIKGVSFADIESVEITSALPQYLPDGRKVPDMVRIVMKVKGHAFSGKRLEETIDRSVFFKDQKWQIMGSDL